MTASDKTLQKNGKEKNDNLAQGSSQRVFTLCNIENGILTVNWNIPLKSKVS